jgi:hypothetical protein
VGIIYADWERVLPMTTHREPLRGPQQHALRKGINRGYSKGHARKRKTKEQTRAQKRLECQATLAVLRGERPTD